VDAPNVPAGYKAQGKNMRRNFANLAVSLLSCTLVISCAAEAPQVAHLDATVSSPEHDEAVYQHVTMAFFPNRTNPQRIIIHSDSGGSEDFTCMDPACQNLTGQIVGSTVIADGTYQVIRTDDPRVAWVQQAGDTVGYLVSKTGTDAAFFKSLSEAQAYEHKGETIKLVGKIILITLLIGLVVFVVAAGAASEANSNVTTTRCTTFGVTTTCTTR
jgi:hypothetical protein